MAGSSRMMKIGLGAGALACALAAAVWWTLPKRSVFYTDAESIRQDSEDARLRDILWRPPTRLDAIVNGAGDEIEPRMERGGEAMYFSRRAGTGDCDLYVVRRDAAGWGRPEALLGLNTLDNELGPTPSPDGRWLYFASDRPGGLGGFDLWRAPRLDDTWGAAERLPEVVNSSANEAWPALSADGTRLVFASDRAPDAQIDAEPADGVEAEAPVGGYDLFAAEIDAAGSGLGDARRLEGACSERDDVAPAFSPVGDFLYFASDRDTGRGGFDLYRTRLVDGAIASVEALGAEVNSPADELDPTLSMGGFELHFSSNRPTSPPTQGPVAEADAGGRPSAGQTFDLFETTSREVFLGEEVRRGDLWALLRLLPWILAALAAVLLLSLLRRMSGDEAWRVRWGTLSLMAKCVLFSLIAHAALLALLSLWQVKPEVGDRVAGSEVGVSLTSRAISAAVESQMRGGIGDVEIEPAPEAPSATMALSADALPTAQTRAELRPAESSVHEFAAPMASARPASEAPARTETVATRTPSMTPDAVASSRSREAVEVATPRMDPASRAAGAEPSVVVRAEADAAPSSGAPRLATIGDAPAAVRLDVGASAVSEPSTTLEHGAAPAEDARAEAGVSAPRSAARSTSVPSRTGALDLALPGASRANEARRAPVAEASIGGGPTIGEETATPRAAARLGERESNEAVETDVGVRVGEAAADAPLAIGGRPEESAPERGAPTMEAPRTTEAPERIAGFEVAIPSVREREPEPEPASRLRVTGLVADAETREPIEGATVRLDVEGREPMLVETDSTGAFSLSPDRVPDHSAVTASKHGYVPAAMNVSERDFERGAQIVLLLERHNPFVIALEERPEVHHLGNDEFSGRVNSQFQRMSEGTSLTMRFELDAGVAESARGARLEFLAKGVQLNNPVYVNGRRLRRTIPASPSDGSFDSVSLRVPLGWLVNGRNEIEFRSVRSPTTDVDDYEFVNVRVVLDPGEVGL